MVEKEHSFKERGAASKHADGVAGRLWQQNVLLCLEKAGGATRIFRLVRQELPGASRSPPQVQLQLQLSGTIVTFSECSDLKRS